MARPANEPTKMLRKLATQIQANLESLVDQYDAQLAERPGYNRLPETSRRLLEGQLLDTIAEALNTGDSHELVQYVRQRALEWAALGFELAWFQESLSVPENLLVPLIDSVAASTFLWQALNRSQGAVWQIAAERTQATEHTLRQSQQLLQAVMDNIPQAVFWKDQNLTYLGCNRAFAEDAGLTSPAQVVGKTDWDMPWKEQAELYRADDRSVMDTGTAKINYEEPQTSPTGEQTWLRTSKVPMRDATGQVTAVLGMYEDITERRTVESVLARERNLLRTLIDTLPDQIFVKDAQGHIILHNEADARAMGVASTAEALGKTVFDLYPQELAEIYHADDMAVIQSGQSLVNQEEPSTDETGQPRWVLTTKVPFSDPHGKPLGLVGVARDITERKRIEATLLQSEERFRRFSESTQEGLVFHENGLILDANTAVVALFGFAAPTELIGRNLLEFVTPESRALVIKQMQLEDVHPYEVDCIRQDGSIFPVETATRTYQFEGRTVRASSVRDISRRKQLEQSIRDSYDRRSREVEVTRQVAQEIATATDVDAIFPLVVKLIKERFAYYHAQIFRYDSVQDAVVLVAGYGEAGQRMLAAGHHLPMGRGVVGMSAQTGEAILATDSTLDTDWQPNPNLPDTKGELAVPIKFHDEILGILDVQSDRANALDQNDVLLLEVLAGQIAVAIANTRTLEEASTFRALADAAGQGIAFADVEGRVVYANAAIIRMFGLNDLDELVGRSVINFYPEAEHGRVQAAIGQAIQTGQWMGELNVKPIAGSVLVPTINNVFLVRDNKGQLRHIANIVTNITERKLVEQRLADAIRLAKIGYWSYDVPTDTFTFNDQFYALMHTTAEREGGYAMTSAQYAQRFVHPDDAPLVGTEIGKALAATDPDYRGEVSHRVYFGDGELGYVTVRFTIEQDAQGKTIRTSGANQDITDIRRAEEELRTSEAQLSQALQAAKLGYWSYDVPTDTFIFNDQFYALMRTTAEREGGYTMTSAQYAQRFVHPDDAPLVGIEIGKALAATDPDYRGEVSHRVYFGDGELGYVTVRFTIEQDAQGKTIRTSGANQDITDIRQAEEELRTSEAQLTEALQVAKLAYWEYDVEKDLFQFNDQFFAIFHSTVAQHGGYQLSSAYYAQHFVHPDDLPIVGVEIEKALTSTDRHYNRLLEHRILYADGGVGYITVNINIDRDEQGKILRYYGANQDITERKLAEEAVRTSEAQLTEALQVAKLAYWEYDVEKDLFQFNDQFFAIFHSTVAQHGGYQLSSAYYAQHFVHPDDLPIVGVEIEKALTSTDRHYNRLLEHRILYADGGVGYITVNINIDRDEQGKILRYYGANQDITERKLAEEAVRTSEAQLSQALQIAKLAYWEYDVEKDLFQFNDQFFAIFHSTAEQHGGYQISSAYYAQHFVHPDDLPIVGVEIEKALTSTDRHYNRLLEHRILYADGGVGYIAVNINIDRDEQGKILRYYGANQDITERKQADLERERLLRDVERRANQVEAAAEVSAAAATIVETQPLLDTIVQLAQRRFNLYHCHIFLPDEANRTFTVRACGWREGDEHFGTTEDRVIQTGATQSLVSRAVRTRQPVIVDDVRADPGWLPNPALPHVRSEIALPMIVGNEVLGVFNVHSDELAHFTEDDARALFALATQAAVALQNARLFEQTRRTAEELDLLNRRLTGDVWNAYVQRKSPEHVLWASDAVNAPAPLPGLTESLATGQLVVDEATDQSAATITAPIILRGETVGALRVRANADEVDENVRTILSSIASHIAQAAENTRLLEESEARLARERALAEATDKIRRRTEVNHILETAAAELAQYLQASTVSVRVSRADDATSD